MKSGETIECERCCYEHPIEDMIHVDDAYWCTECNDTHDGYICTGCHALELKYKK